MNKLSAYDIVRNPVVTEKSTMASENNQVSVLTICIKCY